MRKILRKVFTKISTLNLKIARKIYKSPEEKRLISWFNDKGDQTLRLNYDLTKKSIVFDVGG
ncbi:MAG: hypothetical protein KAQ95_08940, partial [Candidatus Heimdallarchaeota archaeon]|nr:hypothetical protein [Candidatus Heimdallarchaeota archaeon]